MPYLANVRGANKVGGEEAAGRHRRQLNMSDSFAISQYPRPGVFPTEFPNSDRPRLRDIKIMGYSLRTDNFRYTIWLEFNSRTFKRSEFFFRCCVYASFV